ncbi:MAG: hypothetical protein IKD77_02390 [Bacilli bacterium]|nr:hypothetical protein [Bacilli bacterium]MBR3363208.1 hypothetical protein [Bacilli bacterium]
MLNEIWVGRYCSENSKIHQMNPISKTTSLVLLILLILISSDIILIVPILLLLIAIFMARIPKRIYIEVINNLKTILILIFLIFLIFGVLNSLFLTIKVTTIILFLTILTLTTPTTEIIYGLEKTLYPLNKFKIKSNILALNIGLFLKFIPCFIDAQNNILKTELSRGINYKSNLKNYIKAMTTMVKPAFKIAKIKHNNIKNSMYMRLYSIDKKRCNFRMNNWKIFDTIVIIILALLLILSILKGWII